MARPGRLFRTPGSRRPSADAAAAQETADGKIVTFYQDTEPTADGEGDIWFDTNDGNKQYRWSGAAWVEVQDAGIGTAIANAATAQETADGKIVTFVQPTAPTAEGDGDLWMDSDDNYKPYRWNSQTSHWDPIAHDAATWSKITGTGKPEDGATNDSGWRHGSDPTKINGAKIYGGSVGTGAIAANGITQIVSAYTEAGTPIGTIKTDEQSATITPTGGPVIIFWGGTIDYIDEVVGVTLQLYRDSTLLAQVGEIWSVADETKPFFAFYQETPSAASHTYYLKARVSSYNPISITAVNGVGVSGRLDLTLAAVHGLVGTGIAAQIAGITGITGSPDLNGAHTVDVHDADDVKINGTNGLNYSGPYTSGGTFWKELQAYLAKITLVVMELKR